MNIFKMMGQFQEAKKKMDEIKQRLDNITVQGEAYEGEIKVTANGNRKIQHIEIAEGLLSDKQKLQEMLAAAVNRAIEKAEAVNETEMQSVAKDMMPAMQGMFKQ